MNNYTFFKKYFLRIFLINLLGIIFLSDSISFEQGFISLQGFIYSINKYLLLLFILIETIFSYLQEYGLNIEFLYLILKNFFSLNFKYSFFILYEKINYLIYFFLFIFYIFYLENKILIINKYNFNFSFFIYVSIIVLIIFFSQIERFNLYLTKLKNFEEIAIKYSVTRNDNWFLKTIIYFNYEKETNEHKFKQTDVEDSNIKGLMAKDKSRHINITINPILEFLELEQLDIDYEYYYVGKYNKKDQPDTNTINKLKEIYDPENSKLFNFIGRINF